jgi:imidazoleglycerol phosphate dehydratase HisB
VLVLFTQFRCARGPRAPRHFLPCAHCDLFCFQNAAAGTTLHIRQLAGKNSHHIVEATFKAFARALRKATEVDERRAGQIASSKGVLTQQ